MKNIFKRILSLVAVVLILVSSMSTFVMAAGIVDAAKLSVVAVRGPGSGDVYKFGTGFVIGEVGKPVEYVVTNNHVVDGHLNDDAFVYFNAAAGKAVTARICFSSQQLDLAILKLPEPTNERKAAVLCPGKLVDLDDTFMALGYPADTYSDFVNLSMDDITVARGGIKRMTYVERREAFMLDIDVKNGYSGGPVVNSEGQVVGITTFGKDDEKFARWIDEIIDYCEDEEIPVTVYNAFPWTIVAIAGAIVLVIIVLVIILVARSGKKNVGSDINVTTMVTPEKTPGDETVGARVIAVGGTLNGRKFNVSGAVRVGRDPSKCTIVFPVNTQGVSALHCEIAYLNGACYVKDLGSSYGTYTMDGTKLTPNAPQILKSGDKFYLASPENTFEVRF